MKKLGFGAMRLPVFDRDDPKTIDLEQVKQMVDSFLEQGFVYFDTAYPYHGETSELAIRTALVERHPRDSYLLADKMPILRVKDSKDYPMYFEDQLKKCGVEYFDYYLLHNMGRDRYINTEKYGGFPFLEKLKREGLVRFTGFSFHDDAVTLDRILTEHPEVDFVQLQINYLDWDGAVAQSGKCYEVAKKHGKPVTVMEPVKGGNLAKLPEEAMKLLEDFYRTGAGALESMGKIPSPASLAIRYAASLENVQMVLSGMSSLEQLKDNTSYMRDFKPLSAEEQKLVAEITRILNRTVRVPCTGCRYCLEECPMNINIPDYFGLLNLHAVTGNKTNMYYQRFSMNHGKASECLKCGLCENICPQHIEIRNLLEEFKALYEPGVTPLGADVFGMAKKIVLQITVTGIASCNFFATVTGIASCNFFRGKETFDSEEGRAFMKGWGVPDNYMCQDLVALEHINGEQPVSKPGKSGRLQIIE